MNIHKLIQNVGYTFGFSKSIESWFEWFCLFRPSLLLD